MNTIAKRAEPVLSAIMKDAKFASVLFPLLGRLGGSDAKKIRPRSGGRHGYYAPARRDRRRLSLVTHSAWPAAA